jgi:molybdenum cofactor cytidylyltransferase
MNIAVILLAAGSSSRLGQSKQLLKIGHETLLEHSAKAALNSGASSTIVVLGSNEKTHREHLKNYPLEVVYNPDWQKGMGSSIKVGLTIIMNTPTSFDGVIIMVCDQPLIKSDHIKNLISKFTKTRSAIVASAYGNALGVPALFSKSHFQALMTLDNEHGAKKIIQQHPDDTSAVDFPEGEIDIDTLEDYQKLLKQSTTK